MAQIRAAILLTECRDGGYWAEDYSTFSEYVEQEVGLPMRTAQELMRVIRKCVNAEVESERIAEIGWSKVALIASELTKENADDLLKQANEKTYSQLQELLRQKRKNAKSGNKTSRSETRLSKQAAILVSEKVLTALQCASLHTRDTSAQANLEFVAAKFIELCPPPSRLPESQNWN